MKRIILSVMVLAFAVAVQAGDAKTCQDKDKDKPACCASKVKTSTEAKRELSLCQERLLQASAAKTGQADRAAEPEGRR